MNSRTPYAYSFHLSDLTARCHTVLVEGGIGVGKTTVLARVRAYYEEAGFVTICPHDDLDDTHDIEMGVVQQKMADSSTPQEYSSSLQLYQATVYKWMAIKTHNMITSLRGLPPDTQNIVFIMDRSMLSVPLFTILRTNKGTEPKFYTQLFNNLAILREEVVPFGKNLVILMYNSNTLENLEKIRHRQRPNEPEFPEEFITALNTITACFASHQVLKREINQVTIDVAGLSRDDVWDKIRPHLTTEYV